jgi:6-pyruvoyl-tetrahydropterin synthase
MAVIRLTKEFTFEMAHALAGYDGLCREIHGHSYRLFVTVAGEPESDPTHPKYGMVMDFGVLKKIVNDKITGVYDHALLMRSTAQTQDVIGVLRGKFSKVMAVDYQPTCENLLLRFADLISPELPQGVRLFSLRLHETATSYAEWYGSDNL